MDSGNEGRSGRRHGREFKNNAVALVQSGRIVAEVARDLGVSKWSPGDWARLARKGRVPGEPKTLGAEPAEQRELRRLRQEPEHVSRQCDILKKALGILSAEVPPPASRRWKSSPKTYPVDALAEALEVGESGSAHVGTAEGRLFPAFTLDACSTTAVALGTRARIAGICRAAAGR